MPATWGLDTPAGTVTCSYLEEGLEEHYLRQPIPVLPAMERRKKNGKIQVKTRQCKGWKSLRTGRTAFPQSHPHNQARRKGHQQMSSRFNRQQKGCERNDEYQSVHPAIGIRNDAEFTSPGRHKLSSGKLTSLWMSPSHNDSHKGHQTLALNRLLTFK